MRKFIFGISLWVVFFAAGVGPRPAHADPPPSAAPNREAVSQQRHRQIETAEVLGNQGRFDEAEAIYARLARRALEPPIREWLDQKRAELQFDKGNGLLNQSQPEEAEAAFRRAIELNPHDADFYNNLAIALELQGRHPDAAAAIRKALALNLEDPKLYNNLGIVLRKMGREADAEEAYLEAIDLNPDNPDFYVNLAASLEAQGRFDEAEAQLRKALEISPNDAAIYVRLGSLLRKSGDEPAAEQAYHEALGLEPNRAAR